MPKLIDIGFAPLRRGENISRLVRKYALPEQPSLAGYREMEEKDVAQVGELLRKYLARFELNQRFDSDDEVRHWFLSGKGTGEYKPGYGRDGQVVWSYVVEVSYCVGESPSAASDSRYARIRTPTRSPISSPSTLCPPSS